MSRFIFQKMGLCTVLLLKTSADNDGVDIL